MTPTSDTPRASARRSGWSATSASTRARGNPAATRPSTAGSPSRAAPTPAGCWSRRPGRRPRPPGRCAPSTSVSGLGGGCRSRSWPPPASWSRCAGTWWLVAGGQDYAFARPSLTDKKLRSLELRAGLPPRRGQRGRAAAYSLKEVRRRERALAEQAELAYRQLVGNWQPKPPPTQPTRKGVGVAAATGARRSSPQGGKLRGRASSPKPLLFAPGSTTPNPEPNGARTGGQRRPALKLSSVLRSLGPCSAGNA
jgi:hypothetical protein